jgi:RES domain-containing protein
MNETGLQTLWRISNYSDLSGKGGKLASGRWHTAGRRIVYLADSPAAAMLETLVHLDPTEDEVPDFYQLLKISISEKAAVRTLRLPVGQAWREKPQMTRRIGDAWLQGLKTPLASIPSVIVPQTWNYLFNPEHPDAEHVQIIATYRERFDNRLFLGGAR